MSDKLEKLKSVLELVNRDVPSTRDVADIISKVIIAVKEARVSLERQVGTNKEELTGIVSQSVKKMDRDLRSVESSLEGKLEHFKKGLKDEAGVGLDKLASEVYQELRKVKDSIPSATDLSEVFRQIEEVKNKPALASEEIRDRLELLDGDERLDKSAIKGLEDLEKQISSRPVISGGITQAKVLQLIDDNSVTRISVEGETPLTGAVTLSEGAGINLTQTGNDIEIASTADLSTTLLDLSANSTTAPTSVYNMSAGIPVNFKSSDGNTILYLDETSERIGLGTATLGAQLHVYNASATVNLRLEGLLSNSIGGRIQLYNDAGNAAQFSSVGSAASSATVALMPSSFNVSALQSGGLYIGAGHASGAINFFTAGFASSNIRWKIDSAGHFLAPTDNTLDIGASGATRPRTGYFGTSVITPKAFVTTSESPASNGTGTAGQITWDASYIYVCTATNTWKRAALTGGY